MRKINNKPKVIEEWKHFLQNEGYKNSSVEAYIYELSQFCSFLYSSKGFLSNDDLIRVKSSQITNYLESIRRGRTRRKVTALHSFYQFVRKSGYRKDDPTSDLHIPPSQKKKYEGIDSFLLDVETNPNISVYQRGYTSRTTSRDQIIINLVSAYGLKIKDIVNMNIDDINNQERIILMAHNEIILTQEDFAILSSYINNERIPLVDGESALFIGSRTSRTRLTIRSVQLILHKYTNSNARELIHAHRNRYKEID